MKRTKSIVSDAKVMIAFFIHLHIVIMKDGRIVRKIMKSRKTSVLLNECGNL